jgi:ABC-type glutathione transport system ATPase component
VNPDVLVLDEAFSGLDAAACDRILRLLADLQAAHGITYICISHDLDLLASFCSEIALMQDGRIVERGPAHAARRAGYEPDGRARELLAPAGAVA